MPPEEQESPEVEAARASLELAFKVIIQIAALSIFLVLGSLFGGLWLDRMFSTRPLFTVLLLVGSFPISLYIIYRVALRAVAKIRRPSSTRKGGTEQ